MEDKELLKQAHEFLVSKGIKSISEIINVHIVQQWLVEFKMKK